MHHFSPRHIAVRPCSTFVPELVTGPEARRSDDDSPEVLTRDLKKKEEKKPHFLTHGLFLVLAASSAHQSLSFPPDCLFTSSVVVYPRCLFFFFLLSPLSSILSRSRSLICRADHIRLSVIIAGLQPLDIKQPSPRPLPIVLPP